MLAGRSCILPGPFLNGAIQPSTSLLFLQSFAEVSRDSAPRKIALSPDARSPNAGLLMLEASLRMWLLERVSKSRAEKEQDVSSTLNSRNAAGTSRILPSYVPPFILIPGLQ